MSECKQPDRDSIADYDQAIWRLVVAFEATDREGSDALDLAVQIVADIYWRRDSHVWRDIFKRSRGL